MICGLYILTSIGQKLVGILKENIHKHRSAKYDRLWKYRVWRTYDEYFGDKFNIREEDRRKEYNVRLEERRWVGFAAGRMSVQEKARDRAGVKTRTDYWRWHDWYKPVGIPKFPNRVFKKEWKGWNDWLGTDNTFDGYDKKFGQKYEWRDFWEAVRYVQGLGLKNKMEYLREHRAGNIPKDIPMAPDMLKQWKGKWKGVGWPGFLGKTLTDQVVAIREVKELCVVYNVEGIAANILGIKVLKGGKVELGKYVEDKLVKKVYVLEEGDGDLLKGIMYSYGREQEGGMWLFVNVNEFMYELDSRLIMYRE